MELLKLDEELISYCKVQLKKGCGKCKMRSACCVSHPITEKHLNQYTKNANDLFKTLSK